MRCTRLGAALTISVCAAFSWPAPARLTAQSSADPAFAPIHRGERLTGAERAYEMWIPKGFRRSRQKSPDGCPAFFGETRGAEQLAIREDASTSLSDYMERIVHTMRERSGSEVETVEELRAGPYPAAIVFCPGFDQEKHAGWDMVIGAFATDAAVAEVFAYLREGETRKARAVAQVRWILGTVRAAGPAGLEPFLRARHVDAATGVSYRSHRGFVEEEKRAPDAAACVFAGFDRKTVTRLVVARVDPDGVNAKPKRDGLARQGHSWRIPCGEAMKLTGAYYAGEDRGIAFVGCEFADGFCVEVCASGPVAHRDAQLNVCERVALALEHVDIEKVRAKVGAAVAALETALQKRKRDAIDAQAKVLASCAFLDPARISLATAVHRITDAEIQAEVVTRLGETGKADVARAILRTLKHPKTKKRDAVRRAALRALGEARDKRAISELKKHVKRGQIADAMIAVRSLGRYAEGEAKKRVTKELIRLYARIEKAGKKARKVIERDRWQKLAPVFRAALEPITGETFASAAEAAAWLRKP